MDEIQHELPAPLTSPDCNLRGFEYMPLHGDRLFRSAFDARATDAEFRAALRLWWAAWWEIPAASLPNNERDLARAAGVDIRKWRRMRPFLMEKWVLCADDRWYHPFLADIARDSFSKRRHKSTSGRIGAEKRWGINGHDHGTAIGTPNGNTINKNSERIETDGEPNGVANSKRSEEKRYTPPTPPEGGAVDKSKSKPQDGSTAIAKTQHLLHEQRTAADRATTPPGGKSPSEFLKNFVKQHPDPFEPATRAAAPPPAQPTPRTFDDLEP